MSRRGWVLVLGAALLVTITYLAARTQSLEAVHSNDEARLRALDQRIAALEAQLRGRSSSGPSGQSHLVVPVEPAKAAEAAELQPKAVGRTVPRFTPVDEVALQREYFGDLDVRLAGEARDPNWAVPTEEKLRHSVEDLRPRITIDNARCGQTMCRVETRVAEVKDDATALNNFVASATGLLPEAVVADGEGPGHHIVYFARKGTEFPPMNAPEATAQQ
jgi:hypothetical protein